MSGVTFHITSKTFYEMFLFNTFAHFIPQFCTLNQDAGQPPVRGYVNRAGRLLIREEYSKVFCP